MNLGKTARRRQTMRRAMAGSRWPQSFKLDEVWTEYYWALRDSGPGRQCTAPALFF